VNTAAKEWEIAGVRVAESCEYSNSFLQKSFLGCAPKTGGFLHARGAKRKLYYPAVCDKTCLSTHFIFMYGTETLCPMLSLTDSLRRLKSLDFTAFQTAFLSNLSYAYFLFKARSKGTRN
jgi:hypothetical protein